MNLPACSRDFQLRVFCQGVLGAFVLAGLAACGGEHLRRPPEGATGSADEAAFAAIPRMEAKAMFFGGKIEAEALLARAGAHWGREAGSDQAPGRGGSGGRTGGHVGGFGGGRGGHRAGAGRGGPPEEGSSDEAPRAPVHASNQPPAALRLRLTNHSSAPVDVEVIDFDSSLGDFVVEPAKISLAPGQSAEAEPMVSRLGVGTAEIPLTVKLRIGGRSEQQVLTLRTVPEASPEPPAPTALQTPPS